MNKTTCQECGRMYPVTTWLTQPPKGKPIEVVVEHGGYGCDTGRCGHSVIVRCEGGDWYDPSEWAFSHRKDELWEAARHTADHLGIPFNEADSEFSED